VSRNYRQSDIMWAVCVCVFVWSGQHVNDQLALHASGGTSSLCSLLALVGQSQSDLLAIVPAKLVIHFYGYFLVSFAVLLQLYVSRN